MGEFVELTADDGHQLAGYVAGSPQAPASVVIVQEIFGVNSHIRSVVDHYAELGFRAIAPAMFDRAEPGVDLDYDEEGFTKGMSVRAGVPWATTTADVGAALAHVRRDRPTAVIGFCFGGGVAWLSANELNINAAIGYYGGQIHDYLDRAPACPTLLHFGELDAMIPHDHIDAIRAGHPTVDVHVYEGADHGFNCDVRASYHPEASAVAQEHTLAFLAANGVG